MLADFNSCRIGSDLNGGFNPLSLLMGGKINLLISVNGSNSMMLFVGVDKMASAPPTNSVIGNQSTQSNSTGDTLGDVWRIGTLAPPIYERVYVKIPYNSSVDETQPISITLNKLYDNDWAETWNITSNPSGANVPSDYSDYNTTWFNRTKGGMPCINTSATADCYVNYTGNYLIVKFPHFSNSDTTFNGKRSVSVSVAAATSSGSVEEAGASITLSEKKSNWYSIEPSEPVSMEITDESFEIRKVDIAVKERVMSPKIAVSRLASKPSSVPEPTATAYRYLEIKTENLADEKLDEAKIKFRVARAWLKEKGLDKSTVKLQRHKNGWTELPTRVVNDDEVAYVYYEATTPGFSYFAITAAAASPAAEKPAATAEEEEEEKAATAAAAEKAMPAEKPKRNMRIWWAAGALLAAALAVALWFMKRKRR